MSTRKKRAAPEVATPDKPAAAPPLDAVERQRLLARLASVSQLTDVDMVKAVAERRYTDRPEGPLTVPPQTTTNTEYSVQYVTEPSATGTSVLVSATTTWQVPTGERYAVVQAVVRLAYTFSGLAEAPHKEVLGVFANELGAHHAWPFLRERLRTLSGDLNVPPLVLPLRKPNKP